MDKLRFWYRLSWINHRRYLGGVLEEVLKELAIVEKINRFRHKKSEIRSFHQKCNQNELFSTTFVENILKNAVVFDILILGEEHRAPNFGE